MTFLFTDIVGSTRLLQEMGDAYAAALTQHRQLLRAAFGRHTGVEVDTQGDALFVAFARASDALAAARDAQEALTGGRIRVRMGLHTGEPLVTDQGYVGIDVHRAARICAAGHGGQIVVSQVTRQLVGDRLRDLGEHRLKDLLEPERLYQVGEHVFPPLRTLRSANLPVQETPLVGRLRELHETVGLLRQHRLLTILGPGGVGKTRLALQLAAEASDEFPDGVTWVPLATVRAAELVEPAIAQVLGARGDLAEHLAGRRALLLLDNVEQVVGVAPRLAALLAGCPDVRILATSRQPLRIRAEQRYVIEPLGEADAVTLFVERARAIDPTFVQDEAVVEICRRLDGLPLALELAAALVNVFVPTELLARLEYRLQLLAGCTRDLPERQNTMRATFEWSHDLLTAEEQGLLHRLAVFPASLDVAAAEAVCGADLATLSALVDKCLVRRVGTGRFGMLETLREFAREKVDSGEADELADRHGEYFNAIIQALIGFDGRPSRAGAFEQLDADVDNLRIALRWALSTDRAELTLRLGTALFRYWRDRGHYHDAAAWVQEAPLHNPSVAASLRASALDAAGVLAYFIAADVEKAERFYNESLALHRELGDSKGVARLLNHLGAVAWERGRMTEALDCQHEALGMFEEAGDDTGRAMTLHFLGDIARDRGQYTEAEQFLEQAVGLFSRVQPAQLHHSTHSLGDLALDRGEYGRAISYFVASLELTDAEDARSRVMCIAGLMSAAAGLSRFHLAARLWGAVEAQERDLGFRMLSPQRQRYQRWASRAREQLGDSDFAETQAEGEALPLNEAVRIALAVA